MPQLDQESSLNLSVTNLVNSLIKSPVDRPLESLNLCKQRWRLALQTQELRSAPLTFHLHPKPSGACYPVGPISWTCGADSGESMGPFLHAMSIQLCDNNGNGSMAGSSPVCVAVVGL